MELRRIDPPDLDGRGEPDAVVAPGHVKVLLRPRVRIIRVHEIEMGARGNTLEEPELSRVLHAIPSHVRNLPAGREPPYGAGHDVEPAPFAELLARREQQLIAEADAEKRTAAVERATERWGGAQESVVSDRVVERAC